MGRNNAFWQAIEKVMPASEDGLIAVDPRIPCCHVLCNPIQPFLHLLRHLCKQVLSWDPEDVHK